MMPSACPSNNVLPQDFQPGINEIVIGRGKRIAEHCGNKRLHVLVASFVKEYAAAPTKRQKSAILSRVVSIVRNNSAHQAGFVKQSQLNGEWRIVEDAAARITVAQAFRDALHVHYKSSKQFKQQKRQDRKDVYRQVKRTSHHQGQQQLKQEQPFMAMMGNPMGIGSSGSSTSLLQNMGIMVPGQGSRSILGQDLEGLSSVQDLSSRNDTPSSTTATPVGDSTNNEGFSRLFRILEESIDVTKDPFEPTPISEQAANTAAPSFPSLLLGNNNNILASSTTNVSANSIPSSLMVSQAMDSEKLPSMFVPDFDLRLASSTTESTAV